MAGEHCSLSEGVTGSQDATGWSQQNCKPHRRRKMGFWDTFLWSYVFFLTEAFQC